MVLMVKIGRDMNEIFEEWYKEFMNGNDIK